MMTPRMKSVWIALMLVCGLVYAEGQEIVYPERITFTIGVSVNGSSIFGNCQGVNMLNSTTATCSQPTTSVLLDGVIPTLTGIDGNMWASQLLTLRSDFALPDPVISFDFTNTPGYTGVGRVEVILFNCPEYRITPTVINIRGASTLSGSQSSLGLIYDFQFSSIESCESLIRDCAVINTTLPVLFLEPAFGPDTSWVHLAELKFYGLGSGPCQPPSVLDNTESNTPPTAPPISSSSTLPTAPPTSSSTLTSRPMTVQPTMAPVSMEPRTMEPEVLEPDTTEPEIFGPVASQLQITASTTINALRSITPTSRVLSSTLPMATGLANGFTVTPQISSTRDLFPSPSPEPTTLPEPETTDGSGIVETTEPATSEQETTDVGATEPATTAPPEVVIGWEQEVYTISESLPDLRVESCARVFRGEVQSPVTVTLYYGDGNATGRVDYPPEAETRLSFSPLVNRACVNISIFDDNEVEGTETFEVFLGTSSDSSITLRPNLTIIVILDNDQETTTEVPTTPTTTLSTSATTPPPIIQIPTPLVTLTPTSRLTYFGGQPTIECVIALVEFQLNMPVMFTQITWNISNLGEEPVMSESFAATNLTYPNPLSVSTSLTLRPLSRNVRVTCSGVVMPANATASVLASDRGESSLDIFARAPPLSLEILPSTPITIADVSPYNSYMLTCNASLPSDLVNLNVTLRWADPTSGEVLMPNDTISIQNCVMIFEPTVTIFSSILSIREVIAGNATVMRQCRAVVNYQEQSERELVTSIFVTSANTSKNVIIKGASLPASVQQSSTFGRSPELAILQWTVPRVAYTPESYQIEYSIGGDDVPNFQYSDIVAGTTNISAVNTMYIAVIRNLSPNQRYSAVIISSNTNFSTSVRSFPATIVPRAGPGIYNLSDLNLAMFPIGAEINMLFENIRPRSKQVTVFSLSQRRVILPTNVRFNLELSTLTITFQSAFPSLTSGYVLCIPTLLPDSRRKRIAISPPQQCGEIFYLNITTPSLNISTNLLILEYDGNRVTSGTAPSVSCVPSDPRAPVRWRTSTGMYGSNLRQVLPRDLQASFDTSSQLFHTVTFPRTYEAQTPPNVTYTLVCDLVNIELPSNVETSPQNVTVRFLQSPLSILNADKEVFPTIAVINSFTRNTFTNSLELSITCFSTAQNSRVQWESRNVSGLTNGEIMQTDALNLTYVEDAFSSERRIASLYVHSFGPAFIGYYICRSQRSNRTIQVFTTLTNPLWEVSSIASDSVPMGAEINITVRYGDNSLGFENRGNGFSYVLRFLPCVATQPDETRLSGVSNRFSNEVVYPFRARLNDSGEYQWNATHIDSGATLSASLSVLVIRPHLVEFDRTVYVLPISTVTLRCLPNDTRAPILWRLSLLGSSVDLRDRPSDYRLSPSGLGHYITFNTSALLPERPRRQSLVRLIQFTCGFMNGGDRRIVTFPFNTILMMQQERIRMFHTNGGRTILNNTVINRFMMLSRRSADSSSAYEAPLDFNRDEGFLSVDCSGVQGDHMVLWITDNEIVSDPNGVVNCDPRPNRQMVLSNYSSRLRLDNLGAIALGNYSCRSSISSTFQTFQISLENPYIRRISPEVVSVERGRSAQLTFHVALNSDGSQWSTSLLAFTFTNTAGEVNQVGFTASNSDFPQYLSLSIQSVEESHAGIYRVRAPDLKCNPEIDLDCPAFVSSNITLRVISYCEPEISNGFLWPRTVEDSVSALPCNLASSSFRRETRALRPCMSGGLWGQSDLTTCTLRTDVEPFLLVWFVIENSGSGGGISMNPTGFSADGIPDEATRRMLETEMQQLLEGRGVQISSVSLQSSYIASISLTFEVILSSPPLVQASALMDFNRFFSNTSFTFAGFDVREGSRGSIGVTSAVACPCSRRTTSDETSSLSSSQFLTLCAGVPSSPCSCTSSNHCQCVAPFVGDGMLCTVDTDGDTYPDRALLSQTCISGSEAVQPPNYCRQDNCPTVANIDQDQAACLPQTQIGRDFNGCPFEADTLWQIMWPNTERSTTSTQRCPGGLESRGNATRFCDSEGVWSDPNVLLCESIEFANIRMRAIDSLSSMNDPEVLMEQSIMITEELERATSERTISLLPTDLQTTNTLISTIVNVLENITVDSGSSSNENVINVFNNILDENNTNGWSALQANNSMNGSELLLNSAERYGLVLARSTEVMAPPRRLSRTNIAMSASQYNGSSELNVGDLNFPTPADLVNYTSDFQPLVAKIPPERVFEQLAKQDLNSSVPVVHILFKNLEDFLPPSLLGSDDVPGGASVVYSTQIGDSASTNEQSQVLEDTPLSLKFTFNAFENVTGYTCAFWNFSEPVGNGSFVTNGVITDSNNTQNDLTSVHCLSTHLTSFAVLVDVSGGLQNISPTELRALEYSSYIGCAISIICLTITVIFFLCQRKKLFESVNYFVHLNLAATLLVAFVVFVFGIELGNRTTGGCLFVALMLHYLFLAAFCWMLCEGVMLYLLLVVVFSRVTRQWWLFVLIGYVTPIPIVVISVAARHQYYGVRDSAGNLLYCWLSVEKGTIFAFVVPMLVIILINIFFLVLGLHSLWKSRKKRFSRNKKADEDKSPSLAIAKSLFIATIVLLPLLGLTWVFGILTINASSTVFAWLFTIFNSLQGAAIFFFHVIRNDKVWSKLSPKFTIRRKKAMKQRRANWYSYSQSSSTKGTYNKRSSSSNSYSMETLSKGTKTTSAVELSVSRDTSMQVIAEETKVDLGKLAEEEAVAKESGNAIRNEEKDAASVPEASPEKVETNIDSSMIQASGAVLTIPNKEAVQEHEVEEKPFGADASKNCTTDDVKQEEVTDSKRDTEGELEAVVIKNPDTSSNCTSDNINETAGDLNPGAGTNIELEAVIIKNSNTESKNEESISELPKGTKSGAEMEAETNFKDAGRNEQLPSGENGGIKKEKDCETDSENGDIKTYL